MKFSLYLSTFALGPMVYTDALLTAVEIDSTELADLSEIARSLRGGTNAISEDQHERRLGGQTCRLKMYWQKDYFWQGGKQNHLYRSNSQIYIHFRSDSKPTSEEKERKWCAEENDGSVRIKECSSTSRQKWILNEEDGTIRSYNDDDRCLERRGSSLSMRYCKRWRREQQFSFDVDSRKFEIRDRDNCVTQEHHPRSNERLLMETCTRARHDDTSLWECN